jgi:hypothetical protein
MLRRHLGVSAGIVGLLAAALGPIQPWAACAAGVLAVILGYFADQQSEREISRIKRGLVKTDERIESLPDARKMVSPAILGQGQLATLSYEELIRKLREDFPILNFRD